MHTGAVILLSVLLASASVEEIEKAVQSAYDGGGYQTGHPLPRDDHVDLPEISPALVVIIKALLWTGAAVLLLLLVVAVIRRVQGRDARDVPRRAKVIEGASAALLDQPLGDADAMAAQGRYDDAVHVLLLRTIQALAQHQRVPPSLTSREILARLDLEESPRDALGRLVRVVEVSLFGGRKADKATYETCVEAFEALRASLGRGTV